MMRAAIGVATLALATTLSPSTASADEGFGDGSASASASANTAGLPHGLSFGVRTGYMIPTGSAFSANNVSAKMSDTIAGGLPLWLDAGYRITPNIYVGLYADLALLFVASTACPSGASCSGSQFRIGANAHYHFLPDGKIDPWAGLGIGYEHLHYGVTLGESDNGVSASGFEFVNLQVGGDYKLTDAIAVGPFLSLSFGEYGGASINGNDVPNFDKTLHEWFTIGVRGKYDL
jgi:outer membrane protein W